MLTIYDRPLGRTEEGRYRLPEGRDWGGFRTEAPHGQRSSLWLKEEEWKALIPEKPRKGQTAEVPAKLGKRGVEEIVELDLSDGELSQLREAAEGIRAKCADLGKF